MKAHGMSLKECYAVLRLPEGTTLEEVKRAYRKRAFELHPDLNPSAGASRQFQQLNEAYVILIRLLDVKPGEQAKPTGSSAGSAKTASDAYREQARSQEEARQKQQREKEKREQHEKERQEQKEAERRLREKQEKEEREKRDAERRERLRQEIERQEAERLERKQRAQEEKERQEQIRREAQREREELLKNQAPRAEAYRRTYTRPGAGPENEKQASPPPNGNGAAGRAEYATSYAGEGTSRETLLNDLLNDPFARRVYEDIYSEVQNRRSAAQEPPKTVQATTTAKDAFKEPPANIGQSIKRWMRSQIDEEQELSFPASSLYPGAKFRLKIRPGLSGEPRTIEVTLPPDFKIGKSIRLAGMGKKVGKWQGDLYLTFQIKS